MKRTKEELRNIAEDNGIGCAFPFSNLDACDYLGLTKREYFAGLALQSVISSGNYSEIEIAYFAVKFADELLEALEEF
jgi:hypothetical protein